MLNFIQTPRECSLSGRRPSNFGRVTRVKITQVAVIGSGTMGNGIAHVFALQGAAVRLIDVNKALLEKALSTIGANLERQVAKHSVSPENAKAALARIFPSLKIADASDCQLAIEAV